MPENSAFNEAVSATRIKVALFRQIHHLPLVWQGATDFRFDATCDAVTKDGWEEVTDPLRSLATDRNTPDPDPDAFNEFVYFHDFVRDFLFPHGGHKPYRLFEKPDPGTITASFDNKGGTQDFDIERLTLHIFRTKVAILTVETVHKAGDEPLTLARVQTIIDHFRRSYTPFWSEGQPQRVPLSLSVSTGATAKAQDQKEMASFLEKHRKTGADAPLLEPWEIGRAHV